MSIHRLGAIAVPQATVATLAACGAAPVSTAPTSVAPRASTAETPPTAGPTPGPTPTPAPTPAAPPPPAPPSEPPEITRLEWTSYGNTTGGTEPPLPGERVQTYRGVRARAPGAVAVTLSFRDARSGCAVPSHCWSVNHTYRLERSGSAVFEHDFVAPYEPAEGYGLKVTCRAEEGGSTESQSTCLPVPGGC